MPDRGRLLLAVDVQRRAAVIRVDDRAEVGDRVRLAAGVGAPRFLIRQVSPAPVSDAVSWVRLVTPAGSGLFRSAVSVFLFTPSTWFVTVPVLTLPSVAIVFQVNETVPDTISVTPEFKLSVSVFADASNAELARTRSLHVALEAGQGLQTLAAQSRH